MEQPSTPLFFQYAIVFVIIAFVMMLVGAKKHKVSYVSAGVFAFLSIVLGLFLARAIYCFNPEKSLMLFYDEMGNYTFAPFWKPAGSGFHVGGFILGIFLAAPLTVLLTKAKFSGLMDSICLPALFLFAAIRFIEPLSDAETLKGLGSVAENSDFCFSPLFFQITSMDEETGATLIQWRLAVHLLEAILAIVILFALHRKKFAPGILSMYTAVLLSASQLLPESLRQDGPLCISIFLRVSYISYGVLFGCAFFFLMYRAWKHGVSIKRLATETALVLLCIGLFVICEFVLDGKIITFSKGFDINLKRNLFYGLMAVSLAGMAYIACQRIHKENEICLAE